jgi:hypothetical protein
VNFSRTPSANSRERRLQVEAAWRTGHCPVHHRTVRCPRPKQPFGCTQPTLLFFLLSVSNTQTSVLVHKTNVLRLRNIPLLMICNLSIHGHRFTFKHLCLQSITKILRNGPRAHFPFRGSHLLLEVGRRRHLLHVELAQRGHLPHC